MQYATAAVPQSGSAALTWFFFFFVQDAEDDKTSLLLQRAGDAQMDGAAKPGD